MRVAFPQGPRSNTDVFLPSSSSASFTLLTHFPQLLEKESASSVFASNYTLLWINCVIVLYFNFFLSSFILRLSSLIFVSLPQPFSRTWFGIRAQHKCNIQLDINTNGTLTMRSLFSLFVNAAPKIQRDLGTVCAYWRVIFGFASWFNSIVLPQRIPSILADTQKFMIRFFVEKCFYLWKVRLTDTLYRLTIPWNQKRKF